MGKRQPRQRNPSSTEEIAKAVHQLQEYHALGLRLLQQYPSGRKHNQETVRLEAAEYRMNPVKIYQIRDFAHETHGYTDGELKALVELCWTHSYAPGFTVIAKFLSAPNKKERTALQRDAIKGRWSLSTVQREIIARFGRRKQAGKRPDVLGDLNGFYADLQTRAMYWGRLKTELRRKPTAGSSRLRWSQVPKTIRELLDKAVNAMKDLEVALEEFLPSPEDSKAK
jgi:hypothetical protein